tara:strand:- start:2829 stop:4193 length:1365 start_codon:yes stop_codon:yes gene_type:complete
MKFLILDVYPSDDWRLVKDTAGGYGTGNDFGNSFFSKMINLFVSKMINMPPMYAIYVFSILKNKGIDVEYTKDSKDQKKINEADYIIMPTSIIAHETEIEVIKNLTNINKKIFIMGVFSSVMKEKYNIKNSYVVPGEPESFFLKITYNKNDLDNFFQNKEKIEINNNFVDKLDDLPFPDWKYYSDKYPLKNNFLGFNSKIAIPIIATRGCPYSCFNYCTYPLQQGRKVRMRSAENVVDEIKYWIQNLNTNKFVFRDPVFSINRKFTVELCNLIIKNNLKIQFLIETHLNNLDEELIDLLKKAGLEMVYIGIESSSAEVLNGIKRFTVNNDEQYQKIKKLVNKKIIVKSMYMFGNPDDNVESIKTTIKYSKYLPNQLVQYSVFTPYPGTPIYKTFEDKIVEKKYEHFNQYNLVYKHNSLNNSKLIELKNLGYRSFYFSLGKIFIVFKSLFSLVKS